VSYDGYLKLLLTGNLTMPGVSVSVCILGISRYKPTPIPKHSSQSSCTSKYKATYLYSNIERDMIQEAIVYSQRSVCKACVSRYKPTPIPKQSSQYIHTHTAVATSKYQGTLLQYILERYKNSSCIFTEKCMQSEGRPPLIDAASSIHDIVHVHML
jgi:hypothetical protein